MRGTSHFRAVLALAVVPILFTPVALASSNVPVVSSTSLSPDSLQNAALQALSFGRQHADLFGGVWIDSNANRIHVLFTDLPSGFLSLVRSSVGSSRFLLIDKVARSENQLAALQRRIERAESDLGHFGVHLVSVGEVTSANRLEVDIRETSPTASSILERLFGADTLIVRTGVSAMNTATRYGPVPPYRGGIELNNKQFRCTAGYMTGRLISGVMFYQILTAGHCFNYLDQVYHSTNPQYGGGTQIGQVIQDAWHDGSTADGEVVNISGGNYLKATNLIITDEPATRHVGFLDGSQVQGLSVSKSGLTTGETNFTVTAVHVTVIYQNPTTHLYDQVKASGGNAYFGDSGGPVYHYYGQSCCVEAEGIQSGIELVNGHYDGNMFYSFIQNERNQLPGMIVCTRPPTAYIC